MSAFTIIDGVLRDLRSRNWHDLGNIAANYKTRRETEAIFSKLNQAKKETK